MPGQRGSAARGRVAVLVAGSLSCALLFALAPQARANVYAPNKLGDHAPNGCTQQDCTLREAVLRANAHAGADTIVLVGGNTYSLSIPGLSEQAAQAGDLDLNSTLTIKSSSATKLATVKQAPDTDRVFETGVLEPAQARLVGLRITGGNGGEEGNFSHGGGILNDGGTLSLVRSKVVNNHALEGAVGSGAGGGGVAGHNFTGTETTRIVRSTISGNRAVDGGGVLTVDQLVVNRSRIVGNKAPTGGGGGVGAQFGQRIDRSTIADNTAKYAGGVLQQQAGTPGTISNSTIAANEALGGEGGGVWIGLAQLSLRNDTIAANRATGYGGGLWAESASTHLLNVTVARNRSDSDNAGGGDGGGLGLLGPNEATIGNSLIVKNRDTNGVIQDCDSDPWTSLGHNIRTSAICQGFTGSGDLLTSSPKIARLGKNGGPTQTIPLLAGSPAIGHAGQNAPARDQRGVKRDRHPDTGAYERRHRHRRH
jgi:hypothetical protein